MSSKKLNIFAYGFDKYGFDLPKESLSVNNICDIEFIKYSDPRDLDEADGVIMPQGIFETIDDDEIRVDKQPLLDRYRQVRNLIDEDKWVCFLVGKIMDKLPRDFRETLNIQDTDLCKRILNLYEVINRNNLDGHKSFSKCDEFKHYLHDYGLAQTSYDTPYAHRSSTNIIAETGSGANVGFVISNNIFFLPFHTTKRKVDDTKSISDKVTRAIIDYKQKRIEELPDWLNDFRFAIENVLLKKIEDSTKETIKSQEQLDLLSAYKSILTTSGDILKKKIVLLLETFFNLKIDPIDEGREDAKILDDSNKILALIEIKGTKQGIKRDYINQADSHRERNGLPPSVPAILLINNEMSINGIKERLETKVNDEHIKHAVKLNTLIIRTIDLLFFMLHLESNLNRKEEILKLISAGGGWLKADHTGYAIVN